jgi:ABC-2 type transport system permease protein
MWRYFKLYLVRDKNCLVAEMEFRFDFSFWVVVNLIWAFLGLFLVKLIFGQVDSIAGWTSDEAMLLVITNTIFVSLAWSFILPSIIRFHNLIRKGTLDFVLLRPVNPRFLVSIDSIEFDMYPRIIVFAFILWRQISQTGMTIELASWLAYIILIMVGLVIFYNFCFVLVTLNFWFANIFNLENLLDAICDNARFPAQIFNGPARIIFAYILPLAFVATFPTQALLGKNMTEVITISMVVLVLSSLFSQWFWNFALKRYSSASS